MRNGSFIATCRLAGLAYTASASFPQKYFVTQRCFLLYLKAKDFSSAGTYGVCTLDFLHSCSEKL